MKKKLNNFAQKIYNKFTEFMINYENKVVNEYNEKYDEVLIVLNNNDHLEFYFDFNTGSSMSKDIIMALNYVDSIIDELFNKNTQNNQDNQDKNQEDNNISSENLLRFTVLRIFKGFDIKLFNKSLSSRPFQGTSANSIS